MMINLQMARALQPTKSPSNGVLNPTFGTYELLQEIQDNRRYDSVKKYIGHLSNQTWRDSFKRMALIS